MKVLQLIKTSVGARWALLQVRELVRLGVEVHVALPPGGVRVPAYEEAGAHVHLLNPELPLRRPWQIPARLAELRQLVAGVAPDIIHSHFVSTTLAIRQALGKRHPIPRLFQVPGPLHLEHAATRALELATAGPADWWIGSCRYTLRLYQRSGIAPERLFLSYYGTDLSTAPEPATGKLRALIGAAHAERLVGMVAFMYAPKRFLGQTRGLKGHEDFIDALAELQQQRPEVVGVCIGGAWAGAAAYEQQVNAYAHQRCPGRLHMLGTRQDVPDLYPDLDLAIHPSHSENVGGAVESLLLGVPTIATDVGGFPDLVRPGDTGWLVPPRQPLALARAMREALDDPAEAYRRAQRGQALARELFDVTRTAAEVADIYQRVLDQA